MDVLAILEKKWLEPDEEERCVCCTCDECGEDIYEDDDVYEIGGHTYCQSCIDYAHGFAEVS